MSLLTYIDHLQKQNADDLAFYPLTTLEKAIESGSIITCQDNGEIAGYLWFGAVNQGSDTIIYQACVDYDSRMRHLGYGMVRELIELCTAGGSVGIRLKCASSSESNAFWNGIGFYCTKVKQGGIKRNRELNYWRSDIQKPLFVVDEVEPSTKPIDLREYNRANRKGVKMPSGWSRSHY